MPMPMDINPVSVTAEQLIHCRMSKIKYPLLNQYILTIVTVTPKSIIIVWRH